LFRTETRACIDSFKVTEDASR